MPTFKLDGKPIPFEPGDTIIRAAWRQGIEIPHYCWHPGLSAPANCRMCLVEIAAASRARAPLMLDMLEWDAEDRRLPARPEAEAPAVLLHRRRPKGWKSSATRASTSSQRAPRRAGVPAPQPPGRLPHLRSVRRVQAAGLLARARPVPEADARRAGAQAQGRRLRADHRLRRRALRHVHALRPLHGGGREGPRARHARARQPERDHRLARAASSTGTTRS